MLSECRPEGEWGGVVLENSNLWRLFWKFLNKYKPKGGGSGAVAPTPTPQELISLFSDFFLQILELLDSRQGYLALYDCWKEFRSLRSLVLIIEKLEGYECWYTKPIKNNGLEVFDKELLHRGQQ